MRNLVVMLAVVGLALPLAAGQPALWTAIERNKLDQAQAAIQAGEDVNAMVEKDTLLCQAIGLKRGDIVKLILSAPRVDPNKRGTKVDGFNNEWERTPLILAAKLGQTEIVHLLLDKGAEINARDRVNGSPLERGTTPLMMAAGANHLDTLQALFAHGKKPEVSLRDKDGQTALWMASANENLEMVQFLYSKGAKVQVADSGGKSVLTTTLMHKQYEVLDFLVAKGADINLADDGGTTPLMEAILINSNKKAAALRFLERFITFKPKLDLQQIKAKGGGDSALLLAARFGFVEAIQLLLDQGASINLQSLSMGRTPLATAAMSKQVAAANYLLQRGAKTEIADKSAFTPLMLAVIQADLDLVKALVAGGALADTRAPGHNLTPLVAAAANLDPFKHDKCLSIIKVLLDGKADPNFQASDGRSALGAAAASSDLGQGLETATLLLNKGANVDLPNSKGETPLMLASGAGNEKLVKLLLKKDAKVELKSGAGETAMSFALRSGKSGVRSLLEAKGAKVEAPVALAKVVVKDLLGTWVGKQDGMPQALFNLTLKKDNSFDFVSRLTPETLKLLPKGSVNPVIAAQKGTYTLKDDLLVLNISGAAPLSRKWKLEGGILILDNMIRLKKK